MHIGYFLASEEYGPIESVRQARLAEDHGMTSVWISDLPSMDRGARSKSLCLDDDRRDRAGYFAAHHDRRHLPVDADPPGDHCAGRCDGRRAE